MSIILNTVSYTEDSFMSADKVKYVGPDNTFSASDILTLGRVAPKPTSTFRGVARAEAKRTKTVTLDDGSTADAIVTLSCSLPVGMAKADADSLRGDIGAFASAEAETLFWNHDLTY